MFEDKELFLALQNLHKYDRELNQQRVKDGKEWLQYFSECGFFVGPSFYELNKSKNYTRLYGGITEIELLSTVSVACRHDAVEIDDGTLDDEYVAIFFNGFDQTEVRRHVADLISHLEHSGDHAGGKRRHRNQ